MASIKEVKRNNEIALSLEKWRKSNNFRFCESCATCKYLKKYKSIIGGFELKCSFLANEYDFLKYNILAICDKYEKNNHFDKSLPLFINEPEYKEIELTMTQDNGEEEVFDLDFKENNNSLLFIDQFVEKGE